MIVAGIVALKGGNKTAVFYLIGWTAYVVGGLFVTLRNAGKLPPSDLVTHAVEVGSMLEVLFLSIALSDKYRLLRIERQKAARMALDIQKEANEELEQKVKDRTEALESGNQALDKTLTELKAQNDQVVSSINYAERIQTAIMPRQTTLERYLKEVFTFFKPRDIVSGDFYWILHREGTTVVAAADCTGHGVPGAMMSMMGLNLLERVYAENIALSPKVAIWQMDKYVADSLSVSETHVRDGMDIGICVINHAAGRLQFAGAKLALLRIKDGVAEKYKAGSQSIGGEIRINTDKMPLTKLDYTPEDTFYLYSDGFRDQFGGKEKKKYMNKPFRELLASLSNLPLAQQRERLGTELDSWMKASDQKQTDDIMVLGFKP
jgi:serine phosphatase RsbU (regulator of sigma subunit)